MQCRETWAQLLKEANLLVANEPILADLAAKTITRHECLRTALATLIAEQLGNPMITASTLQPLFLEVLENDDVVLAACFDLTATRDRDSACHDLITPFLYYKGYQAIQSYRLASVLWHQGREELALFIQNRVSSIFDVDIHPAAKIGKGILLDHATGVVIGETAVVADNVSIMQSVTLGGTGKEDGDRHPKIGEGVLIGPGCKILGNIEVGRCSKIAAGSVVLKPVPARSLVTGVPAKVVGTVDDCMPSIEMDQQLDS